MYSGYLSNSAKVAILVVLLLTPRIFLQHLICKSSLVEVCRFSKLFGNSTPVPHISHEYRAIGFISYVVEKGNICVDIFFLDFHSILRTANQARLALSVRIPIPFLRLPEVFIYSPR